MNKNKKLVAVLCGVMIFFGAFALYIYFTPGGKNIFTSANSLIISSWNSIFGSSDGEIIDTSPDNFDDNSSSSDTFSENNDTGEENSDIALPASSQNTSKSDDSQNNSQKNAVKSVNDLNDAPASSPAASDEGENNISSSQSMIAATPVCKFPTSSPSFPGKIILNEIAWMGSPASSGENNSDASKNEWIELKNISSGTVSLAGWQVVDISGKLRAVLDASQTLAPGALAVIVRGASSSFAGSVSPSAFYSGTLGNDGDTISAIDPSCNASDILNAATGWPGGNNTTKQTLERDADHAGWHTSVSAGGTPGAENSIPVVNFILSIAPAGDGHGIIASVPSGISCRVGTCSSSFASGTAISLTATPDNSSTFEGWTGACSGTATCSLYIEGPETASAMFKAILPPSPVEENPIISDPVLPQPTSTPPTSTSTSTPAQGSHLLIASIQIAGASSTNDLVKIFNPSGSNVDISGWRLRKRSSTGSDSSIKVFSDGASIAPLGYFMWANSSGGFSETVSANVSSTETLSADNSIALLDASNTIVDAVAWGNGANQYGEGAPFATDPSANQILMRIISSGTMQDTANNASDFVLQ